jgi:hypothetical protein
MRKRSKIWIAVRYFSKRRGLLKNNEINADKKVVLWEMDQAIKSLSLAGKNDQQGVYDDLHIQSQ